MGPAIPRGTRPLHVGSAPPAERDAGKLRRGVRAVPDRALDQQDLAGLPLPAPAVPSLPPPGPPVHMSDYECQRTFNIAGTLHTFVFPCDNMQSKSFRVGSIEWADRVNKIVRGIRHGGY